MRTPALFMAAFFLQSIGVSASYELDSVLNALENREKSLSTLQFSFKQKTHFTEMKTDSVVSGKAAFGKNGKLRIAKESPDNQVTVSDGKKVWVFNPAAKQVWEGSSKKWLASPVLPKGVVPFNNYVADLRKNFNLRLGDAAPDGNVRIIAEPKDAKLGYRIEIDVSTDTWLPVETVYSSESAEVVTTMSKYEINPTLSASTFAFPAPKDADVIPFN